MNGNISEIGITKDLEAMKRVGCSGFQLFQAGPGIPKGRWTTEARSMSTCSSTRPKRPTGSG